MMRIPNVILCLVYLGDQGSTVLDYWDEDYDQGKNCISEDEIEKLNREDKARFQCTSNLIEDPVEAIQKCKQDLAHFAISICRMTRIKKAGDLLYCKNRGTTTCCFDNYECEKTWNDLSESIPDKAVQFFKNKERVLRNIRRDLGYRTCHPIKGYDASICAEDCKRIQNTPLSQECKNRKGFMKCCIRRDKQFCHECRYCCTLPFCTYINRKGEISHISESDINKVDTDDLIRNKTNTLRALDYLYSRNNYYKGTGMDTRCLKPYSNGDPEKWEHYDPDDFANAVNEDQLAKAKSVAFDKRFFNFEDPEVFELMTGDDYQQQFREAYGFDYTGRGKDPYSIDNSLMLNCSKDCLKAEHSNFARQCKRKGGLFKCCINTLALAVFDFTRRKLKQNNYISQYSPVCGEEDRESGVCNVCTSTYSCVLWNRTTNNRQHEYMTEKFNDLGGATIIENRKFRRIPFKSVFCIKQDFCQLNENLFDTVKFWKALDKKDVCDISTVVLDSDFKNKPEELLESKEDCVKRKSNVRICPRKIIKNHKLEDSLIDANRQLRSILRMVGPKYRRKKSRRRRKHKRKTKAKKRSKKKRRKKKSSKKRKLGHRNRAHKLDHSYVFQI